jgi:Mn-dependent DtxR family transcriptional regulator
MNIHESAENYLETILIIKERKGSVRSIDIANELNFSKPSVSVAMKNLRENGYIYVDDGGCIKLTDTGFEIADKMYERHRIISEYFVLLGVDSETAVKDACRIEHIISKESFQAIKAQHDKLAEAENKNQ